MLLLFGVAWLSAAALSWFLYKSFQAPTQEKRVRVVVAGRDMPVGTLLKKTDVKAVPVLEKDNWPGVPES